MFPLLWVISAKKVLDINSKFTLLGGQQAQKGSSCLSTGDCLDRLKNFVGSNSAVLLSRSCLLTLKRQPHKMVKLTQTVLRQFADELFEYA